MLQSTHTSDRTKNIDDEENNINDITTAKDFHRTSSSIMTTTANLESILSNTNDIVATNFVSTTCVLSVVVIPTPTTNTLERNKTVDDNTTLHHSTMYD